MWGQPQQNQQQPFGAAGQSNFGQTNSGGFGGTQTGFQQNPGSGFGTNKPTGAFFGGGTQQQQQPQNTYQQPGQQQPTLIPMFSDTQGFDSTLTSHGVAFSTRSESALEPGKNSTVYNIKYDPKFSKVSLEMLKVLDMLAMQKSAPQPNYEFIAGNEYQQNKQNYVHLQKVSSLTQQQQSSGMGMGGQQTQPQGYGQQQQQFGAQQKPMFGGGTQGFGGQTSNFGQTSQGMGQGMFGQTTPQQQNSFGGNQQKPLFGGTQIVAPMFGGTQNSSGIKPFGQTTTPGFGTQPQTPLFGGGATQTPGFGQQNQATPFGGALFGATTQQQTPLFGGGAQQPSAGLFGQQTAQPTIGLGASGQNTGIGLGGTLFGGQKPAQPAGGLFGNQPAGGNTLFGGQAAAQPAAGGGTLFGSAQQTQPANGGLFGAQPLGQAGSSLFGKPATAASAPAFGGSGLFGQQQTTGGSLFGGMGQTQQQQNQAAPGSMFSLQGQQQQQQATPQQQTVFNPYAEPAKSDPYGGKTSYINQTASPFENASDEIKRLQEEIYMNKSSGGKEDPYREITPLDKLRLGMSSIVTPAEEGYLNPYEAPPQFLPTVVEKQSSLNDKLAEKYKQAFKGPEVAVAGVQRGIRAFNPNAGQPTNKITFTGGYRAQKTFGTDSSMQLSRQSSMQSSRQQENFIQQTPNAINQFDGSASPIQYSQQIRQEAQTSQMGSVYQNQNPDVIKIEVTIPDSRGQTQFVDVVHIHKTREVKTLYERIEKTIRSQGRWTNDILGIKLLFKNAILSERLSLKDAGVDKDSKMSVIYDMATIAAPAEIPQPILYQNVPNSLLPPSPGYSTVPPMSELSRFSEEALQRVVGFSISNDYGTIQFEGEIDLTGVNLAETVLIGNGEVEVYNEEKLRQKGLPYPKIGEKLNRAAIVTFRGLEGLEGLTIAQKVDQLKEFAESMNARHVSFSDKGSTWIIHVPHWTKYSLKQQLAMRAASESAKAAMERASAVQQIEEDPSERMREEYSEDQSEAGLDLQQLVQGAAGGPKIGALSYQTPSQSVPFYQAQPAPFAKAQPTAGSAFIRPVPSTTAAVFQTQQPLPESHAARRRPDLENEMDVVSVASSVARGAYDADEDMIELPPKRGGPIPSSQVDPNDFKRLKAEEIKLRIQKREDEFKKVKQLYLPKPTIEASLKYLKEKENINVKQHAGKLVGFNAAPLKVNRFRPQFRPDGSLLTLKRGDNSLKIQEVRVVADSTNEEQRRIYSGLGELFAKHTMFSLGSVDAEGELRQQMKDIRLNQDQVMQLEMLADPRMAQLQTAFQESFDDIQIREMLAKTHLPTVAFKQNPRDLFFFFEDVALFLIQRLGDRKLTPITQRKLRHEFYTVCLLNALFGNPNIHLVQRHPEFKGLKNYDSARLKFAVNEEFVDGCTFQNQKKRKNALTEVVRFICQQEFKVVSNRLSSSNEEDIYRMALEYLMNGDVKGAVGHLNKYGKKHMAVHVMSCFNNPMAKQQIKNSHEVRGFKGNARVLALYMTGELGTDTQQAPSVLKEFHWLQALCYHLMIKTDPGQTLEDAITSFNSDAYQLFFERVNAETPLHWALIKFFGMSQQDKTLIEKLASFSQVQAYQLDPQLPQDSRLHFFVCLALHNFLNQVQTHIYKDMFKTMLITHEQLKNATLTFINQLIREGDWEQSLLVTSFIPATFNKLRKHLVYSILQRFAPSISKEQANFSRLCQILHIQQNAKIVNSSLAIYQQQQGQYESAIGTWISSGNHDQAHRVLMTHIAPMYFSKSADKCLLHFIPGAEGYSETLRNIVQNQLGNAASSIQNWSSQGKLLSKLFDLFYTASVREPLSAKHINPHAMSEIAKLLSPMDTLQPQGLTIVKRFIWAVLLVLDKSQKIYAAQEKAGLDPNSYSSKLMPELAHSYPQSPELQRVYEELTLLVATQSYCTLNAAYSM